MDHSINYIEKKLSEIEKNGDWRFRINPNHFWIGGDAIQCADPPHFHDFTQIFYMVDGSMIHTFKGKDFEQKKGEFLIVPPFFEHAIDTTKSKHNAFIQCEFSDSFVNGIVTRGQNGTLFSQAYLRPILFNASLMQPILSLDKSAMDQIELMFKQLLNEYHRGTDFSLTYIRLQLIALISFIISEYEKNSPLTGDPIFLKYRLAIHRALEYTIQNYTNNISLKEVCSVALMSVSSFSYVFKQLTGLTFVEYLNYLRVYNAQRLLVDTDHSLMEICFLCGFCDGAYFNNVFKRMIGCTPRTYRRLFHIPRQA